MSENCLIGLGSNLGERRSILETAVAGLREKLDVIAVSKWYSYPAVGGPSDQEDFLNGVVVARSSLTAFEVAKLLHRLEREAGRERVVRWSSRTLDCDLLLFGDQQIDTEELQVPHPRMVARRFVLEPANEVASGMVHPQMGWTVAQLYEHLQSAPPYFCVLGSNSDWGHEIARQIATQTGSRLITGEIAFTGSNLETALKWRTAVNALLPGTIPSQGIVSTFWSREPWLNDACLPMATDLEAEVTPKLLIVTDPLNSEYARRFTQLDTRLRVPTLFLSPDPKQAVEDAVGAVLAID